ncbi:DUF3973 domain-containing protein [Paenibacillus chondroitinus]|uniref:DUF3973 domain-containing protein n=1 Tax=Paenibacillus chondroitinus TaxID=59842 RepID=UPI003988DFEF
MDGCSRTRSSIYIEATARLKRMIEALLKYTARLIFFTEKKQTRSLKFLHCFDVAKQVGYQNASHFQYKYKRLRGDPMYYCIRCKELHLRSKSQQILIFSSGFYYNNSTLYHAGVCRIEKK